MGRHKLRKRIALEAARLIHTRREGDVFRAKMKSARQFYKGEIKPFDLPKNSEVYKQLKILVSAHEGRFLAEYIQQVRKESLRIMKVLRKFHPRLVGSVLTGQIRAETIIEIRVFSDITTAVVEALDTAGVSCEIKFKGARSCDSASLPKVVFFQDSFPFELTIYPLAMAQEVATSPGTGRTIDQADTDQLDKLIDEYCSPTPLGEAALGSEKILDYFRIFESLLLPLETVKENIELHPEGDLLYHSLQTFDLARERLPYDEEFLLAALMHDVGKAIDPADHISAGLDAIGMYITPRVAWLIEHHVEAAAIRDGTLGARSRRRLEANESFGELMLLAECDNKARAVGVATSDVSDALEYIRGLSDL